MVKATLLCACSAQREDAGEEESVHGPGISVCARRILDLNEGAKQMWTGYHVRGLEEPTTG